MAIGMDQRGGALTDVWSVSGSRGHRKHDPNLTLVHSSASAPTKKRPVESVDVRAHAARSSLTAVPADEPPGLHLALAFHVDEPHWLRDEVVAQQLPGGAGDLDLVRYPM
jgi:hypothetical protein